LLLPKYQCTHPKPLDVRYCNARTRSTEYFNLSRGVRALSRYGRWVGVL